MRAIFVSDYKPLKTIRYETSKNTKNKRKNYFNLWCKYDILFA
nr:MAG TPA: hypothetical protein [Caudoviricetes sp.]